MARSLANLDPLRRYLHCLCARSCPYCDFNCHLDKRADEGDGGAGDGSRIWPIVRDWTGTARISSIHFGGGTPSLLARALITLMDCRPFAVGEGARRGARRGRG